MTCVHWWLISPPDGPTSMGTCKKCGATQEFPNTIDMTSWAEKDSFSHKVKTEKMRADERLEAAVAEIIAEGLIERARV